MSFMAAVTAGRKAECRLPKGQERATTAGDVNFRGMAAAATHAHGTNVPRWPALRRQAPRALDPPLFPFPRPFPSLFLLSPP